MFLVRLYGKDFALGCRMQLISGVVQTRPTDSCKLDHMEGSFVLL